MEKIIICYKFKDLPLAKRNQFKRKMFGAEEKTHGGKYTTKIRGYLSDKEYEKPIRSVIIINKKHKNGIMQILKQFNAETRIFQINKEI